jgi:hypothetical protein
MLNPTESDVSVLGERTIEEVISTVAVPGLRRGYNLRTSNVVQYWRTESPKCSNDSLSERGSSGLASNSLFGRV